MDDWKMVYGLGRFNYGNDIHLVEAIIKPGWMRHSRPYAPCRDTVRFSAYPITTLKPKAFLPQIYEKITCETCKKYASNLLK